jgi:hypothetical protein
MSENVINKTSHDCAKSFIQNEGCSYGTYDGKKTKFGEKRGLSHIIRLIFFSVIVLSY